MLIIYVLAAAYLWYSINPPNMVLYGFLFISINYSPVYAYGFFALNLPALIIILTVILNLKLIKDATKKAI